MKLVLMKPKPPSPLPQQRLQAFFRFALDLEEHPFVKTRLDGATFTLRASFSQCGTDAVDLDFDVIHLESLLTRLRQFLSDRELFHFKDVRRAVVDLFGEDAKFNSFYNKFVAALGRPYGRHVVQAFKANGKDVTKGFNFKDLVVAYLYTGAIHSDRILDAEADSAEECLPASNEATKKQLLLELAYGAMQCVKNIMAFRMWTLRRARETDRVDLFPELEAFDARVHAPSGGA
jgi:hypothetical protein